MPRALRGLLTACIVSITFFAQDGATRATAPAGSLERSQ
jgi:hypothetical protein